MTAAREKLAEIVAGLDGVTPAKWSYSAPNDYLIAHFGTPNARKVCSTTEKRLTNWQADLAHIARCSPDAMREIAAYVRETEARATAAEATVTALQEKLKGMEWQTIDTAPKDGRDVLLTSPVWFGDSLIGGFHFGAWRQRPDPKSQVLDPTHFMMIPPLDVDFRVSAEGDVTVNGEDEMKPFSTYPEDRQKLLSLAQHVLDANQPLDEKAVELADLVKAILTDEAADDFDAELDAADLMKIEEGWQKFKAAGPVARVINDNQPGNTAIIEILRSPPTLGVGTELFAAESRP